MKTFSFFVFTLIVAISFHSLPARGVPGDEHWDSQFNWPGTTNVIFAIALHNGKIYTAGYVSAGAGTNTSVEVWDGFQWSAIGVVSGPVAPVVTDMAFLGDTLYVAGSFNNVNGVPFSGLARWDGANWSSAGLTGTTVGLAVSGNNLYVGGTFTNADVGGVQMTNVGYFDGGAWHAMGSGLGMPGSAVRALAIQNGLVYAGGYFTNAGSQFATNIAVWDGSTWAQVGGGLGTAGASIVFTLGFNGSDLYAGGSFTQAGSVAASNIARWDGMNWNDVGGGLTGGGANSLAALNGSVCVAGTFKKAGALGATNFAVWNGSTWSAPNGSISGYGYRVLGNGTNVYVGGNFLLAGNRIVNGITSWDGVNWNFIGASGHLNGVYAVPLALAGDGTNLYAAGSSLNYAGQTNISLIGRFDGTNWSALGGGISGSGVISGPIGTGVRTLALAGTNLYAGGLFTNAGGALVSNIAVWNGSNWSAMGGGPGGAVYSILVRTDGVYAVGAPFYNSSYFNSPFFSRWDGSSWQGVAVNLPPFTDWQTYISVTAGMSSLASIGTNIYIGGYFYVGEYTNFPSGYVGCNNIMRFDGTSGWVMGTGLNSNVTCMAVLGTNLYVAGNFTNAGGISASKIAQWNGNSWTNLGSGVVGTGVINGLTTIGNSLYAVGTFTNMGGVPANRVARWDGSNWYALGSGVANPGSPSSPVNSVGASGNDLFVGGLFRVAGNRNSFGIARWNDRLNFYTPQVASLAPAAGLFHGRLFGTAGLTNLIQATTNFITWTPVFTNTTGICDFIDSNSIAYPFRFYRAALGP